MAKEYKLSPARLKELQEEMTYLKTVREKEVAELIKEARSFGDLSENSEYDEAKKRLLLRKFGAESPVPADIKEKKKIMDTLYRYGH